MVNDRTWRIWGELKPVTSNREWTLWLSRSSLFTCTSVEARKKLAHFSFACSLCHLQWLTAVSQIRCNNGCLNQWKSSHPNLPKPWSEQNLFLFLKNQAPNEIIWCEMRLQITEHFHEIEPSLCTFLPCIKPDTSCKFVELLHSPYNALMSHRKSKI